MRNVWRTTAKICLIVGVPLVILYIILGLVLGFGGGLVAIAINGAIWTLMGQIFWLVAQHGDAKRARLKREGLCYDAEIVNIKPNMMINVGRAVAANAECRYLNLEGKTCLVRSGLFFIDVIPPTVFSGGPREDGTAGLSAKVYVNRDNPRDYYVEVSDRNRAAGADADYDYR